MAETKKLALMMSFLFLVISIMFNSSLALPSNNVRNLKANELKTYIVHVKRPTSRYANDVHSNQSSELLDLSSWYRSFLPNTSTTNNPDVGRMRIIHEYKNVATGFSAALTPEAVVEMAGKEGFLYAKEQKIYSLHTTHSPNFLGLFQGVGLWNDSKLGEGVIIGVLDTGIRPDRASFSDAGVPPPPPRWKGRCDFDRCNNKLIGARDFVDGGSDRAPPLDSDGHGTHTSSTAAGNFVLGANVAGNANGTAAGIAPHAHLAMYRVCGETCAESDILAAIDAAVGDGVDVLSLSLGGGSTPFYGDSIAVGAFGAIARGVFVACSAGNDGPGRATMSNEAPWILTVGASTTDRRIRAIVRLGNGVVLEGESLSQLADFPLAPAPSLVYTGASGDSAIAFCSPGSLRKLNVKGKIVACDRGGGVARIDKGREVKASGGAGMVLMNAKSDGFSTLADLHVLPVAHVSYAAAVRLKSYIKSNLDPTAKISFPGTAIGDLHAPTVSSFSSRGPSLASPGILKPDILGPGVSVLAAWPIAVDNSTAIGGGTTSTSTFNVVSGTSMSCPHLAGVAALLKALHPKWSPAAVKSAIMTTAGPSSLGGGPILDETASPADIFATGSGHVNPVKAADPGLIYDIEASEYVAYLCGLNYSDNQVSVIAQMTVSCSDIKAISEGQLNYPSLSVVLGSESQAFTRTVTNVGEAESVYTAELEVPAGTGMSVNPRTLVFTEVNQKIEFVVEFIPQTQTQTGFAFSQGFLRWVSSDKRYSVTTQISVSHVI